MAARLDALDELFDDALELPVKGKTYRIPSPPGLDGLKVQRLTAAAVTLLAGGDKLDSQILDDDEERSLYQLCLGPVYDEMLADGVDWAWLRHAGLTATIWIANGQEAAGRYWKAAGDPSQLAPNREARRAEKKNGSAAAKSTRKRGSTSGTSARKATSKGRKVAKT